MLYIALFTESGCEKKKRWKGELLKKREWKDNMIAYLTIFFDSNAINWIINNNYKERK